MDEKLDAVLKGIYDSLTDEQKEKAKVCKSMDELTALANNEGIELPDEVLNAIAGGYLYYGKDWEVIDDKTGYRVGFPTSDKQEALDLARSKGLSTEEISLDRVNQIRADYQKKNQSGC